MRVAGSFLESALESMARQARAAVRAVQELPPGKRALLIAGLPVLVVLSFTLLKPGSRAEEIGEARVTRGPLRITVALGGALAPARAESYGAEVPGVEMKILELAPEGSRVEGGSRLIRFDDAPFRRELAAAEGRRIQTQSEAEQARQSLAALVAATRGERSDAEAGSRRAELELSTFVNGVAPLAVQQSAAAVDRTKREAEDARIKYEGLLPFVEKGYISREELRAARLRAEQADADLTLAEQQHRTLIAYSNPQLLAQKTSELESRREASKNARSKGEAQIAQARAAWELAQARAEDAVRGEAEIRRRLALCEISAHAGGFVVYREIYEKGGERRRVRLGDSVFSGQPVLDLPDLSEMLVEGRVKETDIHRIEPGQRAEVRLDAFPDLTLPGRVLRLGALSGGEKSEARTFPLVLKLSGADPRLRPGMSARALILCGEVREALQVPVDAIHYDGNQASCLVVGSTGTTRRRVRTGRSNAFFVEIQEGLREGEVVLIGNRESPGS